MVSIGTQCPSERTHCSRSDCFLCLNRAAVLFYSFWEDELWKFSDSKSLNHFGKLVIPNQLIMFGVAHNDYWVVLWVLKTLFSVIYFIFTPWGVSFLCGYCTDISSFSWSCDCCSFICWSGINSSWLNHKPNHHEWNHICLISDQKNFYNHVHEIKALWTHLNERELLMKWSDHSWRRNFLLVNVISLSFTDHVTSTCSTEIWLLSSSSGGNLTPQYSSTWKWALNNVQT